MTESYPPILGTDPDWTPQRIAELNEARKPRPNDFPGIENDPECMIRIHESWENWLKRHAND